MITVELQGGLGNQLFQVAAIESIATEHGRELCLPNTPKTSHSTANYYQSILRNWKDRVNDIGSCLHQHERTYAFEPWNLPSVPVKLFGYFQNYRYIPSSFSSRLVLPEVPSLDGAFIHIRGGDYVNHPLHDVKLEAYYRRAIQMFPFGTKFYVFTNDIQYTKTMTWLHDIDYSFVDEPDEVRSLALMSRCRAGGICANSTFSWWGAYINLNNRTLVVPSKWFNDPSIYVDGYFFPGCTICQV